MCYWKKGPFTDNFFFMWGGIFKFKERNFGVFDTKEKNLEVVPKMLN